MAISVFLSEEEINKRVCLLAKKIDNDFKGEPIVIIGVLNGAFVFVADLIRKMKSEVIVDFIAVSSYEGMESTGSLKILKELKVELKDKNVIIVEDIIDTGFTMEKLVVMLSAMSPKKLKVATLLHKIEKTKVPIKIDYLGFEIEDKFVVGYGLDYNEQYRELPYIGIYSES